MPKLSLKVPSLSELTYRKQIMADAKTMAYNAGYKQEEDGYDYETGVIIFANETIESWFDSWVNNEPKRYYAYIMLGDIPIGEVSLNYNSDFNSHFVHILIEYDYRGSGYSKEALSLLMDEAFDRLKLPKVVDKIATNREAALKIFKDVGFKEKDIQTGEIKFGKEEQAKYLELTKIRYRMHKK